MDFLHWAEHTQPRRSIWPTVGVLPLCVPLWWSRRRAQSRAFAQAAWFRQVNYRKAVGDHPIDFPGLLFNLAPMFGERDDSHSSTEIIAARQAVRGSHPMPESWGPSNSSLTVADNGNSPVAAIRYADATFARTNVSLLNGTNTFVAVAQDALGRVDTNTVAAYLPIAVTFAYDLNGNLRTNGTRIYGYDDENQLIATWVSGVSSNSFTYDGKMRRRVTQDYIWTGTAWVLSREVRYVYDGNLVVQERDQANVPQISYTRGKDLGGTLEGAGGIGGLLALSQVAGVGPQHTYYHADGNGNVTALLSTNQQVVARYLYDPFGNTLSASGPMADVNLYRFSSKEWHAASGLVYYLYRFYDPNLQRWPNRDPIEEKGGNNLYAFSANNPIESLDFFGTEEGAAADITVPPGDGAGGLGGAIGPPGVVGHGNGIPGVVPAVGYPGCNEEGATRNQRYYDGDPCPCTRKPRRCYSYERCEKYFGGVGTAGLSAGPGWVPHYDCTKCPEGAFPQPPPP